MVRRLAALLVLVPSLAWAGKKPFPASPYSYIYNEGVVSARAEDRISRKLRGVEEQTGHQFVVALFQSLDGESLEDYTNRLFREWRIGSKKNDDGLLFVLFKNDHRWRVEVGYGLEGTLTDLEASEIVRAAGTSYLKAGDYDTAVFGIVDALKDKLGGATASPIKIRPRYEWDHDDFVLLFATLVALFGIYAMFYAYESSRRSHIAGRSVALEAGLDFLNLLFYLISFTGGGGGGGGSGGGGGGFSGGGGSSGGGGASGDW